MAGVEHAPRVYAVLMALMGGVLVVRYVRDHGPDGAGGTLALLALAAVAVVGVVTAVRRSGS